MRLLHLIPGVLCTCNNQPRDKCNLLHDRPQIVYIMRAKNASISVLTHWGRVTHICVSKLTIIGFDNGLSPGRHQAIISTNIGILLIWTLGTNFSEILSKIHPFSFKKMHLKMSSGKRPIGLLNVLAVHYSIPFLNMDISYTHDDVIKWKHSPRYWPYVQIIHRSGEFPHKGQWCRALMFYLNCA